MAQENMNLFTLFERFSDEKSAREWFESVTWPSGERFCPRCGGDNTKTVPKEKPMPYFCNDCRQYFSVKTGTVMAESNLSLRKWATAIYLMVSHPKGLSSLQMSRNIGVTQKTAWMMMQKIRESWHFESGHLPMEEQLDGDVEVDETYIGGKEKNKHANKKLRAGPGTVGKIPVIGAIERDGGRVFAKPIPATDTAQLTGFVKQNILYGANVFTDEHSGYRLHPLYYTHEAVSHGKGEYVRDRASTNSIESFWAVMKRGYIGTYHWWSEKHLHRYVNEFCGRFNLRHLEVSKRMEDIVRGFRGKHLTYKKLTQ